MQILVCVLCLTLHIFLLYTAVYFVVSVMSGSKRASDDGQDVEADNNGHLVKKPRQESDVHAELKILLPSRVDTLQHMSDCSERKKLYF